MLAIFCLRLTCGLIGSLLLFSPTLVNPRFYRAHFLVALGVTVPFALLIIFLMRLVLRSHTWKETVGPEALVGATAEVMEPLVTPAKDGAFAGMVRTQGAFWRAVAQQSIPAGTQVQVIRVSGLTLHVIPATSGVSVAH